MRIAVVSEFGSALPWWLRLQAEGHDVRVFIKPREQKRVGDGLVTKAGSFEELKYWEPHIMLFDSSGLGPLADDARRYGIPVVGGGKFMDKLEKDREFGFEVAQAMGCDLPPYKLFPNFDACLSFARTMDAEPVYFKSDRYIDADATHGSATTKDLVEYLEYIIRRHGSAGRCMLQKKMDGVPLSTARWWNGRSWAGPYQATIEHKKFLDGDVGPSTGCAFNSVWFYPEAEPVVAKALEWDNLSSLLLKHEAPPGLYDINAVAAPDGKMYFLEWTPRLGYDSEMTSFRLFDNLGDVLFGVAYGRGDFQPSTDCAYSVRLSIPPYPWEHSRKVDVKSCLGTYISGDVGDLWSGSFIGYQIEVGEYGLEVASSEGIIGLTYGEGPLQNAHKGALKGARSLQIPGLMYRTDGAEKLSQDAQNLKKAGFGVHEDLLR